MSSPTTTQPATRYHLFIVCHEPYQDPKNRAIFELAIRLPSHIVDILQVYRAEEIPVLHPFITDIPCLVDGPLSPPNAKRTVYTGDDLKDWMHKKLTQTPKSTEVVVKESEKRIEECDGTIKTIKQITTVTTTEAPKKIVDQIIKVDLGLMVELCKFLDKDGMLKPCIDSTKCKQQQPLQIC